jgi:glycosyltransferase involved in cell wall biosynthesis
MKKKTICILTTAHPLDDKRVYHKFALSFTKHFDVIWIGPELYSYQKVKLDDNIDRVLFNFSSRMTKRLQNNRKVLRLLSQQKNVDYVYIPDPDLAFFYSKNKSRKNYKSIFDIHEVFHKDLLNRRVPAFIFPIASRLVQYIMRGVVKKFNVVIGVNSIVLGYYINKVNCSFIVRSCLPQDVINFDLGSVDKKQVFTVVHGKNHIARGTETVLKALSLLKSRDIHCKVLMIEEGDNNQHFEALINQLGLADYIELHKPMSFAAIQLLMSKCHTGLIAYGRDLGVDSLPNRFFEYMALALPVIVPEFSTEMVEIVKSERLGIVIDTESPDAIADSFEHMIKNTNAAVAMGERGRAAFLDHHNWEVEVTPLIEYLNDN